MAMSYDERLESYRRYNASVKGQKRDRRYEDRHPERKDRGWSAVMLARRDKDSPARPYPPLEDPWAS